MQNYVYSFIYNLHLYIIYIYIIFNLQPSEIKEQLFRKIETKSKQLITNNLHQEFNSIS